MVNAFIEKVVRLRNKHVEGAYDHVLHAFAIVSAIPPLCFLTVDLNRYQEYSALHHVQHRSSLILDAIALAFVLLVILWNLLYLTIPRESRMPSWIIAAMDFLLSTSVIAIGDVLLSNRTASGKCFAQLGECTTRALGLMQGAGGLMILTSIPHHLLWCAAISRHRAKCKRMKKSKRESNSADEGGAISFENEIIA